MERNSLTLTCEKPYSNAVMKDSSDNKPEPAEAPSEPTDSILSGMQLGVTHARLPGLLSQPFIVASKVGPLDWPRLAKELKDILPAELLEDRDWLPPVKLVAIAIRQCPGLLLDLSPEALHVVRVSRLADVLAQATYCNGRGRIVDSQRLRALWASEPVRDIVFNREIDDAVWSFAESVERIEQTPLDVAHAIVKDPAEFIIEQDEH